MGSRRLFAVAWSSPMKVTVSMSILTYAFACNQIDSGNSRGQTVVLMNPTAANSSPSWMTSWCQQNRYISSTKRRTVEKHPLGCPFSRQNMVKCPSSEQAVPTICPWTSTILNLRVKKQSFTYISVNNNKTSGDSEIHWIPEGEWVCTFNVTLQWTAKAIEAAAIRVIITQRRTPPLPHYPLTDFLRWWSAGSASFSLNWETWDVCEPMGLWCFFLRRAKKKKNGKKKGSDIPAENIMLISKMLIRPKGLIPSASSTLYLNLSLG